MSICPRRSKRLGRCDALDSVIFPPSTHRLGCATLAVCENLKVLQLPEGLEVIDSLLLYCTGLESLVVPSHVSRIEYAALAGCQHLHKVELPATVTYLGDSLFFDGTPLDTLLLGCEVPPTLGVGVFEHYNTVLIVPCGAAETYRQHSVWGRFANIVENCDGINEADADDLRIYSRDGRIIVEGAEGETVQVFDMAGRLTQTFKHSSNQAIHTAQEMLKDDSLAISEISDRMGFRNPSSFTRFFKKHTGQTPMEYRNGTGITEG